MAEKLDIFRVLNALNEKNTGFYSELTEEEQKAFQPFLVMRWMSGTSDARQVYFINEFVNPYTFSLPNHKGLLWQLLVLSNSGRQQRYTWNKLPGSATSPKPASTKVVAEYFKYSTKDAVAALLVLSYQDVVDLAEELGIQPDELAKIKKEFK
jgi:hypothetical protein